jgi:glucosamine--fructose-6-phosphate aminotransferase (isomerizing)
MAWLRPEAFTTQLAGLFLLTLALAQNKGRLSEDDEVLHLSHAPLNWPWPCWHWPLISWAEDFT